MKKIIAIALSFLFISLQSVKAEVGVGITAAAHMFDVQVLRQQDQAVKQILGLTQKQL